ARPLAGAHPLRRYTRRRRRAVTFAFGLRQRIGRLPAVPATTRFRVSAQNLAIGVSRRDRGSRDRGDALRGRMNVKSPRPPDDRERALSRWELLMTVLFSGAVVMLIEILGTRIVGPVFGVSLFVWAALLSVTLCALAIGYAVGGVLIDR